MDSQFRNQDQVQRLLQEPIQGAEGLVTRAPADAANGGASAFCMKFRDIANKYPFDPKSSQEVSLDQFYAVFGPTSDAWTKLTDSVKPFALKVGSGYAPTPSAKPKPSPSFMLFLNRMAALSEAFYPSGSLPPNLSYTLKPLPSNLEGVELKIGNKTLAGEGAQETFAWTGSPEDISVTTKGGDIMYTFKGPWAIFRFVGTARYLGGGKLEWVSEINGQPVMLPNGKVKSFDYQLRPENPFFDLAGLKCVSQVVGH